MWCLPWLRFMSWWPSPTGTVPPSPPTSPPSTTTRRPCGWRSSPPGWQQPSTSGPWSHQPSWWTETSATETYLHWVSLRPKMFSKTIPVGLLRWNLCWESQICHLIGTKLSCLHWFREGMQHLVTLDFLWSWIVDDSWSHTYREMAVIPSMWVVHQLEWTIEK